jgi:hypothetical protein
VRQDGNSRRRLIDLIDLVYRIDLVYLVDRIG